jgi:exonuclease SbcD
MRLLHASDWHIGRIFHGASLLEDQAARLDEFVRLAKDCRPDVVVVAGDLYDRAVPPADAVRLLGDVLDRLVREAGLRVVAVAGNHDSPDRIDFAAPLLESRGLTLVGRIPSTPRILRLEPKSGPVDLIALPFATPPEVREATGDATAVDATSAFAAALVPIEAALRPGARSVLVSHAFVDGGEASPSERPLSVGGTGGVPASLFERFDYVALGHLHRPQQVGSPKIRYSGSLLEYSFDEAGQRKGAVVVELRADAPIGVEPVELSGGRRVRRVEGRFDDLLAHSPSEGRNDWVEVTLDDPTPILDAARRLREIFPNLLSLRQRQPAVSEGEGARVDRREGVDELRLFGDFLGEVGADPLDEEDRELLERLRSRGERSGKP